MVHSSSSLSPSFSIANIDEFLFYPESTLLRDINSNDVEIAVHVKDIQAFQIPTLWEASLFRSGESKPRITGMLTLTVTNDQLAVQFVEYAFGFGSSPLSSRWSTCKN